LFGAKVTQIIDYLLCPEIFTGNKYLRYGVLQLSIWQGFKIHEDYITTC